MNIIWQLHTSSIKTHAHGGEPGDEATYYNTCTYESEQVQCVIHILVVCFILYLLFWSPHVSAVCLVLPPERTPGRHCCCQMKTTEIFSSVTHTQQLKMKKETIMNVQYNMHRTEQPHGTYTQLHVCKKQSLHIDCVMPHPLWKTTTVIVCMMTREVKMYGCSIVLLRGFYCGGGPWVGQTHHKCIFFYHGCKIGSMTLILSIYVLDRSLVSYFLVTYKYT